MKGFAKRFLVFVFSIVLLLTFTTFPASADDIDIYLPIPHTTDVVGARVVTEELDINILIAEYHFGKNFLDGQEPIRFPTAYYNCHSYAWYSQETDNCYWIEDPSEYYDDHRYCIVTDPRVGDKICYFDNMGTTNTSDDKNIHSGIVSSVRSDGTVMVTSKWADGGLFEHEWYRVPYYYQYSGPADYVVYYRYSGSMYSRLSLYAHNKLCSVCNTTTTEPHYWIDESSNYRCSACNMVSMTIPEIMSLIPENLIERFNDRFDDADGAIALDNNTILCRIDGEYFYVKGSTVENAVTYVRQELEIE